MNDYSDNRSLMRQASAWISLALSFSALALLIGYVAIHGISQNGNTDEGTPARIFQLLMTIQLPIIAFFAVKWLPKRPKQSLLVLAFQAAAWIIPIISVIWLESL